MKQCSKCHQQREPEDFNRLAKSKDGRQPVCRSCASTYGKARYAADPERFRDGETQRRRARGVNPRGIWDAAAKAASARRTNLKRNYGVTPEWVAERVEANDGCAICHTHEPAGRGWHVDHNHETGENREPLCHHCNVGIGHFHDDPATLEAAARYLRSWQ